MLYEVNVIRDALVASDIRNLMYTDPDEWDRFEAEFIVNYFRTHGFKLAALESEISFDD